MPLPFFRLGAVGGLVIAVQRFGFQAPAGIAFTVVLGMAIIRVKVTKTCAPVLQRHNRL